MSNTRRDQLRSLLNGAFRATLAPMVLAYRAEHRLVNPMTQRRLIASYGGFLGLFPGFSGDFVNAHGYANFFTATALRDELQKAHADTDNAVRSALVSAQGEIAQLRQTVSGLRESLELAQIDKTNAISREHAMAAAMKAMGNSSTIEGISAGSLSIAVRGEWRTWMSATGSPPSLWILSISTCPPMS